MSIKFVKYLSVVKLRKLFLRLIYMLVPGDITHWILNHAEQVQFQWNQSIQTSKLKETTNRTTLRIICGELLRHHSPS